MKQLTRIKPDTRQILIGDVLEQLERLPKNSFDCIVTSPPYWGIRDYGIEGQWGLEPDFKDYLFKLKVLMRGLRRVLKPTGSCWINIGDTYGGTTMHADWSSISPSFDAKRFKEGGFKTNISKPKKKSRLGIPSRFLIQCMDDVIRHPESNKLLDDYSWILRNDIPWEKPNAMPSSIQDRLTNRWEAVFFFVKEPKYYFNLDAIRIPFIHPPKKNKFNLRVRDSDKPKYLQKATEKERKAYDKKSNIIRLGKFRDEQRKQDNFIKPDGKPDPTKKGFNKRWSTGSGWDRNGNCLGCGKPKSKHKSGHNKNIGAGDTADYTPCNPKGKNPGDILRITSKPFKHAHFATFPPELPEFILKCSCPPGGRVLDPFMGAGTTAKVAEKLGLKWLGIEIKKEYCDIALEHNLKGVEVQLV